MGWSTCRLLVGVGVCHLDRRVPVEHLMEPLVNIDNNEVLPVKTKPIWINPIWDYLLNATLPSDPKEASKLRA